MEEKTSLLSKFLQLKSKMHIFANMNDADILSITKNIRLVKFNPGELIIKEGFTDDDIYYILKGEYNIVANRQVIGSFGADTLIGEMASLAKTKRTASVRANSEVIVFSFRIEN
ncbi:hypothetical protein MNB_ARC-1_1223 [hydrothermal vent metagenome]|uniref:Cyclic nucleotide-binding domain-containing protein n=1 Tax=hydrothermal vent metagenome TaxID=652676 RepID=A0A3B1E2K1_9ZZZZ